MPFGLAGSGSNRTSSRSMNFKNIKHNESGRLNMSGIMHDGQSKKPSKIRQQQQRPQYHFQHGSTSKQTPPRSKRSPGTSNSQRNMPGNRLTTHQYQQLKHQHQQYHTPQKIQQHQYSMQNLHGSIQQSHSNTSQGSRQSSHSKQSSTSNMHRRTNSNNSGSGHSRSSSSGNSRQYHQHQHQHHNRVPSGNSDMGSVHSLPTVTSRSTISDPSSHARNGGFYNTNNGNYGNSHSRRSHSSSQSRGNTPTDRSPHHLNHNGSVAEHRDPYGETTHNRKNQYTQYQNSDHYHQSNSAFRTPMRRPSSTIMIKTTPHKSSNASVGSHQSRGAASYNSSVGRTTGSSTPLNISTAAPRVSTDKHAIKSTKKVIEELRKSADHSYPVEKRIIALTNACAEFDHLDDSRHNLELQNGAALVLCKVLAVIVNDIDANLKSCGYDFDVEHNYDQKSTGSDQSNHYYGVGEGKNENHEEKNIKENHTTYEEDQRAKSGTARKVITNSNEDDSRDDNNDDALRMIATALEMVFRGQAIFVHSAYDKCGGTPTEHAEGLVGATPPGLVPLLLRLIDRAEGLNCGRRMKRYNADVTLVNTTKVLLYLSRVPELRMQLARQEALIDVLSRVAKNEIYTNNHFENSEFGSSGCTALNREAQITKVRVIANLVNQEENKPLLLNHGLSEESHSNGNDGSRSAIGLLDALLRVAHMDPNMRAREYAGLALMDLASSPSNQIPMAKNGRLLGTLVKMILVETNAGMRESAITALQNLAFAKENRILLVSFKHGIVLEALIKALSNSGNGYNEKSRRRAAGALTNLACEESTELMGRHKGLLRSLAIVSTKDESPEVQSRAAMALTKLAASVTVKMESHTFAKPEYEINSQENHLPDTSTESEGIYATLLDALVVASLSPVSNSVSAVLRVKARDPENRCLMAQHPGILDTLADMCLYDDNRGDEDGVVRNVRSGIRGRNANNLLQKDGKETHMYEIDILKDRDNATRALMHLTNESKNRIVMCTPPVLNALVRGASVTDEEIQVNNTNQLKQKQLTDVRNSAIRAIERLATEFSNRRVMAHHEGLLVAIALATEREAKLEAHELMIAGGSCEDSMYGASNLSVSPMKARTLQEQPSPHYAYLAKPLLMSLLVAM